MSKEGHDGKAVARRKMRLRHKSETITKVYTRAKEELGVRYEE